MRLAARLCAGLYARRDEPDVIRSSRQSGRNSGASPFHWLATVVAYGRNEGLVS